MAICFAITLLLNTKSFVKIAEAEPDGPVRSVLLARRAASTPTASAVRLDRLNAWIDTALNRQDDAPRFDAVARINPGYRREYGNSRSGRYHSHRARRGADTRARYVRRGG